MDVDVRAPQRATDRRRPQRGPSQRDRNSVQDALPQLLLASPRHHHPDRTPTQRDAQRPRLREHPYSQEQGRRDPRPDQPRELTARTRPYGPPARAPPHRGARADREDAMTLRYVLVYEPRQAEP